MSVLLGDLPLGDLYPERVELLSLEGRNTTLARYARLARQFGHSVPPVKMNLLRKDLEGTYIVEISPRLPLDYLLQSDNTIYPARRNISQISRRACAFGGCRCLF